MDADFNKKITVLLFWRTYMETIIIYIINYREIFPVQNKKFSEIFYIFDPPIEHYF